MTTKYILDGHRAVPEADLLAWAEWFETADRQVVSTQVGKVRVSTVFLGLDHNWAREGSPILFETMVFGGFLDNEERRYCTWEEAEAGHAAMVKRVVETEVKP